MATQTTNLNLTKPNINELYNVGVFNENFDKIDAALADYVVETGTSGNWTYQKWNSGIAECWSNNLIDQVAFNTAIGALYWDGQKRTLNYPNGLFVGSPVVNLSAFGLGSSIIIGGSYESNQNTIYYWLNCYQQTTKNVAVEVIAKGRWK